MTDSKKPDMNKKPTAKPKAIEAPINVMGEPDADRSRLEDTLAPSEDSLPPYRQPETIKTKSASNLPVWVIPVLIAMLILGVGVGRYWGNHATDDTSSSIGDTTNQNQSAVTDIAPSDEQAVLTVETLMPSQDNIGNTLKADGTISAKDIATVSAKVNGVAIEQILVEEGSRVKAGQVLAVFDTDAVEQQIVQAEADVAEAKATLANAEADAARVLPLIDIDAISRQEADRYRTAALQARAALQAAQARLSNQQLTRNNAKVVAPVSGIISEKMVEIGQVAGNTPLFTIIKNGKLEWQADIDPKLIGEVRVGTPVRVNLPQDQSVMGEVTRIAPTADNNRQITIYASLADNRRARAGMYQTGEFLLGSTSMQTLPVSAIVSNDGYDYVMLVTDIKTTEKGSVVGQIERLRVTLGERSGDRVTVTEPLPMDSHIVKQGGSFLNEGDQVRVVEAGDSTGAKANQADTKAQSQEKS